MLPAFLPLLECVLEVFFSKRVKLSTIRAESPQWCQNGNLWAESSFLERGWSPQESNLASRMSAEVKSCCFRGEKLTCEESSMKVHYRRGAFSFSRVTDPIAECLPSDSLKPGSTTHYWWFSPWGRILDAQCECRKRRWAFTWSSCELASPFSVVEMMGSSTVKTVASFQSRTLMSRIITGDKTWAYGCESQKVLDTLQKEDFQEWQKRWERCIAVQRNFEGNSV